jgi:hypothetical protein
MYAHIHHYAFISWLDTYTHRYFIIQNRMKWLAPNTVNAKRYIHISKIRHERIYSYLEGIGNLVYAPSEGSNQKAKSSDRLSKE